MPCHSVVIKNVTKLLFKATITAVSTVLGLVLPAAALEIGSFNVSTTDKDLREALMQASLTVAAADDAETTRAARWPPPMPTMHGWCARFMRWAITAAW